MIWIPSDNIIISMVVTLGGIIQAFITRTQAKKTREKVDLVHSKIDIVHNEDIESRKKLATITKDAKEELAKKVDENTALTEKVVEGAHKAYDSANSFNEKLDKQQRLLEVELVRIAENLHSMRNSLVPIVGNIGWRNKEEKEEENKNE